MSQTIKKTYNEQKLKDSVKDYMTALEIDDIDNAIEMLKTTQRLFAKELGSSHPFLAVIHYQFYNVYEELGDFDKSDVEIKKAVDWIEKYIKTREDCDFVDKMSLDFFDDETELDPEEVPELERPGVIETIFDEIIQNYYDDEKWEEAGKYAGKALAFFIKFNDPAANQDKIVYTKFILGDIKSYLGNYKEAEELFLENIAYYNNKDKKNFEFISKTYCRLSELYLDQGKFDFAIDLLKSILVDIKSKPEVEEEKRGDNEALSSVMASLGQSYFEKEEFQLAYDTWKEALKIVELAKESNTNATEDHNHDDEHHNIECVDQDCEGCCDDEGCGQMRDVEPLIMLYEDLASVAFELGLKEEAKEYRKKYDTPSITCAQSKYLLTKDYEFGFNEENPDSPNLHFSLALKKRFNVLENGTVDSITKLEEGTVLEFVLHLEGEDRKLSNITIDSRKIFDYSFEFIFPSTVALGTFVDLSINVFKNSETKTPFSVHSQRLYFQIGGDELDLDEEQLLKLSNLMMYGDPENIYGGDVDDDDIDDYDEEY
jgi:tetratricopeptide (TPR) repeat protein